MLPGLLENPGVVRRARLARTLALPSGNQRCLSGGPAGRDAVPGVRCARECRRECLKIRARFDGRGSRGRSPSQAASSVACREGLHGRDAVLGVRCAWALLPGVLEKSGRCFGMFGIE